MMQILPSVMNRRGGRGEGIGDGGGEGGGGGGGGGGGVGVLTGKRVLPTLSNNKE